MNKLGKKIKEIGKASLMLKMIVIGFLIVVFLIPLGMIRTVIYEREQTRIYAEEEIIDMWGGEQTLGGPILVVPYTVRRKDTSGNVEEHIERAYFLPDTLNISGQAKSEKRSRGIYDVTLYTTDLIFSGTYSRPDFDGWRIDKGDILWHDAKLIMELSGMRGLQQRIQLTWDSITMEFMAGRGEVGMYSGQVWTPLPDLGKVRSGQKHHFYFDLKLQGGRSLHFLPLGNETTVNLISDWPSPSFSGSFLPASRILSDEGFEAEWYVLSLGRSYPQKWRQGEIDPGTLTISQFGVNLMIPVDNYLKALRSVKYGVLFILLPFLTFFLFEVFSGRRIHPLQYLLVGFANCLFYLILLSVSEHLSFDLAYLLASLVTVALITSYSSAVLTTWKRGSVMTPVLMSAYIFLYAMLQSEEYALLIGSLGLFVILSGIMIITRRVDWYSLGKIAKPE
jgi:inner membrane protein